ncbi:MAG: hypothetical protein J3K34DRAFT_159349 [Monoraphidium minutum]|nr:MAG: hypothetical protein J3K34DRAFT_159349 [Monoraphidium minutum]
MAWRYTVNIPLWILGKDAEGETVALYRVNVLLQPPDASDQAALARPPFFVLRRYSQFRQLFLDLKAQLPELMRDRALQPPPKHTLQLGGQKELLDRRREELERWMWRLIGHPEVARSAALKAFLEFDKALARAQQQQRCGPGRAGPGRAGPGRAGARVRVSSSRAGDRCACGR